MVHKVKLGYGLFLAVVAKNLRANASILLWHLLTGHELIDALEEMSHVAKTLQANRALIGVACVLLMTYEVNGVSTWHKHDRCCGIKQILPTNRATTLQGAIKTFVRGVVLNLYTARTFGTVDIIFTFTPSANFAFHTVENLLARIIIPEVAGRAEISCQSLITVNARSFSSLWFLTEATEAVYNAKAINCVIFLFIMAKTTWIPVSTAFSSQLTVGPIVRTPKELDLGLFLAIVGWLPVRIINIEGRNITIHLTDPRT